MTDEVTSAKERVCKWIAKFGEEVSCPVGIGPDPHDLRIILDRATALDALQVQTERLIAFYDEPADGSLVGGSAQAAEFMDIVDGIRAALGRNGTSA